MNRRGFLSLFGIGAAAVALDPERLLWVPGRKLISIPAPDPARLRFRLALAQVHAMEAIQAAAWEAAFTAGRGWGINGFSARVANLGTVPLITVTGPNRIIRAGERLSVNFSALA